MEEKVVFAAHPEANIFLSATGRRSFDKGLIYTINTTDSSIVRSYKTFTLSDTYDMLQYVRSKFPKGFQYVDGKIDFQKSIEFNNPKIEAKEATQEESEETSQGVLFSKPVVQTIDIPVVEEPKEIPQTMEEFMKAASNQENLFK